MLLTSATLVAPGLGLSWSQCPTVMKGHPGPAGHLSCSKGAWFTRSCRPEPRAFRGAPKPRGWSALVDPLSQAHWALLGSSCFRGALGRFCLCGNARLRESGWTDLLTHTESGSPWGLRGSLSLGSAGSGAAGTSFTASVTSVPPSALSSWVSMCCGTVFLFLGLRVLQRLGCRISVKFEMVFTRFYSRLLLFSSSRNPSTCKPGALTRSAS